MCLVTVDTISQLVNVYCPPQASFDKSWPRDYFQRENVISCGDFNAKSVLWGSPDGNTRGRVIEKILDECDKVRLNTGMATRWFSGGESHIDLAFVSPGFTNMSHHWEVLEGSSGSDHNIVSMEFQCHVKYEDL